jgi:hypothetical protein
MAPRRDTDPRREFAVTAVANVAPFVGIVWLGWDVGALYVFYWVDVSTMVVVYAGCALFAQQPIRTDGRDGTLPLAVAHEDRSPGEAMPRTVALHPALPPLYPRNGRTALGGLGFALVVGSLMGLGWAGDVVARVALDPLLVAVLLSSVGSHLLHVHRSYFRPRRYEQLSAHQVVEVPLYVVVTLLLAAFGLGLGGLAVVLLFDALLPATQARASLGVVLVGAYLAKTAIEWGRQHALRADRPDRVARLFAPVDPQASEG